jgi:hypothetical protein
MMRIAKRVRTVSAGALVAALAGGCASRFEGSPTAFVYRVDAQREAAGACAAGGAPVVASDTPLFVVLDRGAVASAIACASREACDRIVAAGRAPAGEVPLWAYTLASFAFREDAPPAAGGCQGTGLRVRSSGPGASVFVMEITEQRLEAVPREAATGACAIDIAEGQAATLPCVIVRRYDATLLDAR